MANVQVQFSASIKDLIDATNSVKSAIESVAETATKATATMRGFGEAVGVSLSIAGITAFISAQARAGEEIERNAKFLGVSTTEMQELDFITRQTGGNTEILAQSFARLELNLSKAASTGQGPAAAALRALNVNARDLIGIPLEAQIAKMADAFSRFADGPNKDAIAMALFNRSARDMAPILDQGSEGLRKLAEQADAVAVMTPQAVAANASMNRSLNEMRSSFSALFGTINSVNPAVSEFAEGATRAASGLNVLISTGTLGDYVIKTIGDDFKIAAGYVKLFAAAIADISTLSFGKLGEDYKNISAEIDAANNESLNSLDDMVAKAKTSFKSLLDETEKATAVKPQAPALDLGNADKIRAAIEMYQNLITLEDKRYQEYVNHLSAEVKQHQITEEQKTQAVLAAITQRENYELTQLDFEENIGNLSAAQRKKIEDEKTKVIQDSNLKRIKILDEGSERETAQAKAVADQIASAFNSQLRELISGHENFAQATAKIFDDLVEKMIAKMIQWAIETIAQTAMVKAAIAAINAALAIPTGGASLIPHFATGAYDIPHDMPAVVHQGEMIIPASIAENIRAGVGASNVAAATPFANSSTDNRSVSVNFTNNGGGISASDIQQHARTIAQAVVEHWASNPSTRPSGW